MSQDRQYRTLTPPIFVPRLFTTLKQTTLRGYRSAEALRSSKTPFTSPVSTTDKLSEPENSYSPGTNREGTGMFPTLFTYLQASHQPKQGEIDMETGDFDETPAPSGRPSLSIRRVDEASATPASISSPQDIGPGHPLLKTSASGPMLVDRDTPTAPLLSPKPTSSAVKAWPSDPGVTHENQDVSTATQAATDVTTSHPPQNLKDSAAPSYMLVRDRECLGPEFHLQKTHAQAHHPGLLKGADFCDSGEVTHGVRDASPSSSASESSESSFSDRSGEIHERSAEGLLSVTKVKIPMHRHKGHSHAVKVRPAFQPDLTYHPSDFEHSHGSADDGSQSKVRPFIPELEENTPSPEPHSLHLSEMIGCEETRYDMPISKMRVAFDHSPRLESPQSPDHISKVGPAVITYDDDTSSDEESSTPLRGPSSKQNTQVLGSQSQVPMAEMMNNDP